MSRFSSNVRFSTLRDETNNSELNLVSPNETQSTLLDNVCFRRCHNQKSQNLLYIVTGTVLTAISLITITVLTARSSLPESDVIVSNLSLESRVILADTVNFWTFDPISNDFKILAESHYSINNSTTIKTFDVHTDNTIFWSSENASKIFSTKKDVDGFERSIWFNDSRLNVQALAFDYLSQNLYVIDDKRNALIIIDTRTKFYMLLLTDFVGLENIYLDPLEGLIFVSQNRGTIIRGEMDGSSIERVVRGADLSSMALDRQNKRILWVHKQYNIESSKYDGTDRRHLLTNRESIADLVVVDERLFWMEFKVQRLCSCDAQSCATRQCVQLSVGHPSKIRPIADAAARRSHVCASDKRVCEDICLVRPGGGHRCACRLGHELRPDNRTCRPVSDFLVYHWGVQIRSVQPSSPYTAIFWPRHHIPNEMQTYDAFDFDYDVRRDDLYFGVARHVYRTKLNDSRWTGQEVLRVCEEGSTVLGIAYDWLAGNLYYTVFSTGYVINEQQLVVVNVRSNRSKVLRKDYVMEHLTRPPLSMAIDPRSGFLLYALFDSHTSYIVNPTMLMLRLSLDGSRAYLSTVDIGINAKLRSLAIDFYEPNQYFYVLNNQVMRNGSDGRNAPVSPQIFYPSNVAVDRSNLYVSNAFNIYRLPKSRDGQRVVKIVPVDEHSSSEYIANVKFYSLEISRSADRVGQTCETNNGGCQQFCFSGRRISCGCEEGMELSADGSCND